MIAGRFVLSLRHRPIGSEDLHVDLSGGRLRVEAETGIAVGRSRLRQTVSAEYDARLRPAWCRVRSTIDSRSLECDIAFEEGRVLVRGSGAGGPPLREMPLSCPPLLLVDNCFVTHALASLAAATAADSATAGAGAPARFLAAPAGGILTVAPGRQPILVGGEAYPPPTITIDLLPDLQEHAWIEGSWVDRLAIPQAHLRADWIGGNPDRLEAARA
jgi:hypothetical protein